MRKTKPNGDFDTHAERVKFASRQLRRLRFYALVFAAVLTAITVIRGGNVIESLSSSPWSHAVVEAVLLVGFVFVTAMMFVGAHNCHRRLLRLERRFDLPPGHGDDRS